MECYMYCKQWRSLSFQTGGSKTCIPKDFYKTGGSKTYIPQNFYMKAKYSPLLSEKFGGSTVPSHPIDVIRSIISHYIYFFFLHRSQSAVGVSYLSGPNSIQAHK
ncbi:hypothetical protein Hanom_Chr00s211923g01840901 [Helianthus anomalus]